jgi:hypothetical protein
LRAKKTIFVIAHTPSFSAKRTRKRTGFGEGRGIEIWNSRKRSGTEIRGKWGDFEDQRANWMSEMILVAGADRKNEAARRKIIFLFTRKVEMPYL